MTQPMENTPKKRDRWKRALGFTGIGLVIVILGAGGFGLYEYKQLQPETHFKHVPSVGATVQTPSKSSNTTNPSTEEGAGVLNILLFGSDARPAGSPTMLTVDDSHTDSIMLVHLNLNTHEYNVLSIPRDTRVFMPGFGNTKITSVQILAQSKLGAQQGILYAAKFISNFVGVPINYYAETSSWGLESMVETLGGITMDIPFPITLNHASYAQDKGMHLNPGPQFVNGPLFNDLVHDRYDAPGTDYGRQQLQAAALIGIAKAGMDPTNLAKLPELARSAPQYLLSTNLTTQDIISLGLGLKGNFSAKQVHYYQVQGTDENVYNDPLRARDDEIILDMNQLKQIIKAHFTN